MRRCALLLAVVLVLTGCRRQLLYTPEVQVLPTVVNYGGVVRLRMYGAEIASYRFMGALPGPEGTWLVRLDPVMLRFVASHGQLAIRPGDMIPLGSAMVVLVKFVRISPGELELTPVGVYNNKER
jgi:hypothetical protein